MQCKELETVLELQGLDSLPEEAREHLVGCTSCQDLLADVSALVVAAKRLPAEVDPPDRVWISLRAQLAAEGIIRDAEPVVSSAAPWWQNFAEFFRLRALAGAAATLFVIVGSIYFVDHRGTSTTTQPPRPVQAPVQTLTQASKASTIEPSVTTHPVEAVKPAVAANTPPRQTESARVSSPPQPRPSSGELLPSPSENAYLGDSAAVLNEAEGALPRRELANNAAVDASLRQNLRTLNDFIAECEARLKQNPQDELTREYLNSAYQQKAELLTAMMDSGRSEH